MTDKSTMDCRMAKEIQDETINSICQLQDEVGALFPWKMQLALNEIAISNNTIQLIITYIKQLKGEIQ